MPRPSPHPPTRTPAGLLIAVLAPAMLVAACSSGPSGPEATSAPTSSAATSSAPTSSVPTSSAATSAPPTSATAPPAWLGTRVLPVGPDGFGVAGRTPKQLRPRRIITRDLLPPPADGRFHATLGAVPAAVLKRSSWSSACPVGRDRLRYVTVGFRGFDGAAHTGELLVNASAARDLVTVFRTLFEHSWPIEQIRIASAADLAARPTGDGNVTSAFACRPVRGSTAWSQHAYGLAVDLDPFQNPYVDGGERGTVLPELARAYADRAHRWPGIIRPGSVPVRAFAAIGWGWGGDFRSKKDWMHFSSTGG